MLAETLLHAAVLFAPLAFGSVEPWAEAILLALVFATAAFAPPVRPLGAWAEKTLIPAFLGIVILGLFQLAHPVAAWDPAFGVGTVWPEETVRRLWRWSGFLAVLYAVPRILDRPEKVRRLAWSFLGAASLVALLGVVQRADDARTVWLFRQAPHFNPFGTFYNRAHAANALMLASWMAAGLLAMRIAEVRRGDPDFAWADWISKESMLLGTVGLCVFGLVLSGSGGGLNGALAGGACFLLLLAWIFKKPWLNVAALVLLVLGLLLWGAFLLDHPYWAGLTPKRMYGSVLTRLSLFRSAWEITKDFPVFGIGLGAFPAMMPAYQEEMIRGVVLQVHNDWLQILVETGWLGGGLLGAGTLIFFAKILRSLRRGKARRFRLFAAGLVAGLFGFFVHGWVDFSFQIPATAFWAVFFCAWLAAAEPHFSGRRRTLSRSDGSGEDPGTSAGSPQARAKNKAPMNVYRFLSPAFGLLVLFQFPKAAASFKTIEKKSAPARERERVFESASRIENLNAYRYERARARLHLADLAPAEEFWRGHPGVAGGSLLRQELFDIQWNLVDLPLDRRWAFLGGAYLWRLERKADAIPLLKQGQWKILHVGGDEG